MAIQEVPVLMRAKDVMRVLGLPMWLIQSICTELRRYHCTTYESVSKRSEMAVVNHRVRSALEVKRVLGVRTLALSSSSG